MNQNNAAQKEAPTPEITRWRRDEVLQLMESLRQHYYLFDKAANIIDFFWTRNDPKIPVAAVSSRIDRQNGKVIGPAQLYIDRDSWDLMSDSDRDFVICHEFMHLFLAHAERFGLSKPPKSHKWLSKKSFRQLQNVAQDIAINEMLIDMLYLNEDEVGKTVSSINPETGLRESGGFCTVKSVFAKLKAPEADWPSKQESSDTYIEHILKYIKEEDAKQSNDPEDGEDGDGGEGYLRELFGEDHHEGATLSEEQIEALKERLSKGDFPQKVAERIKKELEEKEQKTSQAAGNQPTGHWLMVLLSKPDPKPRWESIIRRWSERAEDSVMEETWLSKKDRYSSILGNLALPKYEIDPYAESKNKAVVAFYVDTSGSCVSLADRFVNAARSLDPKKFNVRFYSFDTEVYDWDGKSTSIRGGGGTDFGPVVAHSRTLGKLDGVFMLTDGYADSVQIECADKWNIMLVEGGISTAFPSEAKIHELKNFE